MSVYKRGKAWYIDIRSHGQRVNRKAGNTRKEAEEVDWEIRQGLRRRSFNLPNVGNEQIPFTDAADLYLKHCKATKAARTYELELTDYHKHLKPFFATFLTPPPKDTLNEYQALKAKEGYANRTINIHIALLRKIINHAVSQDLIPRPEIKYPQLREPKKQHAFLTPTERDSLLKHFKNSLSLKRAIFGLMTGLRPGELAHLQWQDINLEMNTLTVTSKPPLWIIKTDYERTIALNSTARAILAELQISNKNGYPYVFGCNHKPVLSIRKALNTAAKNANLTKKITPNMLRHTFATIALLHGADIKSIQDILGHINISTTQKYIHGIEDQTRQTMNLVELPTFPRHNKKSRSRKSP